MYDVTISNCMRHNTKYLLEVPIKCINFHCMEVAVSEDSACPRSDPLSFYAKIC